MDKDFGGVLLIVLTIFVIGGLGMGLQNYYEHTEQMAKIQKSSYVTVTNYYSITNK